MKVLIIEDSADLADATADVLLQAGYDVAVRSSGWSFDKMLGLIEAADFGVVLLDLGLGAMDATPLIDVLALAGDGPPVVLFTGADEARVAPLRAKVAGVLRKPFSVDELLEVVSAACGAPRASSPPSGVRVSEPDLLGAIKRHDTA